VPQQQHFTKFVTTPLPPNHTTAGQKHKTSKTAEADSLRTSNKILLAVHNIPLL